MKFTPDHKREKQNLPHTKRRINIYFTLLGVAHLIGKYSNFYISVPTQLVEFITKGSSLEFKIKVIKFAEKHLIQRDRKKVIHRRVNGIKMVAKRRENRYSLQATKTIQNKWKSLTALGLEELSESHALLQ